MYLIQSIPNDTGSIIAITILAYIIGLGILYLVIKAAVKAGTEDLKNQIRFQNNLKIIDMVKNGGHSNEEIVKLRDETLNIKR